VWAVGTGADVDVGVEVPFFLFGEVLGEQALIDVDIGG
jgi:hypothetical protein